MVVPGDRSAAFRFTQLVFVDLGGHNRALEILGPCIALA